MSEPSWPLHWRWERGPSSAFAESSPPDRLERRLHHSAVDPQGGTVRGRSERTADVGDHGGDFIGSRETLEQRGGARLFEELLLHLRPALAALFRERADELF